MRNNQRRHTSWAFVAMALLALSAFLFSFWPLAALAVAVGALFGSPVLAVLLAFVLDLTYGAPPGSAHIFMVPFTSAALVLVLAQRFGARFIFERSSNNTL